MSQHDPRDIETILRRAKQEVDLARVAMADDEEGRAYDAEQRALGLYARAGLDPSWLRRGAENDAGGVSQPPLVERASVRGKSQFMSHWLDEEEHTGVILDPDDLVDTEDNR